MMLWAIGISFFVVVLGQLVVYFSENNSIRAQELNPVLYWLLSGFMLLAFAVLKAIAFVFRIKSVDELKDSKPFLYYAKRAWEEIVMFSVCVLVCFILFFDFDDEKQIGQK